MKRKKLFLSALVLVVLLTIVVSSRAQGPGVTLDNGGNSVTCPLADNFNTGMTCYSATLAGCSNAQNLSFYYGYQMPSQSPPNGTIVLFPGGPGTNASPEDENRFAGDYLGAGYEVIELAWNLDWEDATNGDSTKTSNIGAAACRINTFLNHVYTHSQLYTAGQGMCAQGISAGSAAVAYSLSWYSAPSFVDKVELLSGPVFSDIGQGCEVCASGCPPSVTVCGGYPSWCQLGTQAPWTLTANYTGDPLNSVRTWTDTNTLGCTCRGSSNTSSSCNSNWTGMSIVNGTSTLSYPNTLVTGWLCASVYGGQATNNSSPQGQLFFQSVSADNLAVYAVQSCEGAEGVGGTYAVVPALSSESGYAAVKFDMVGASNPNRCLKNSNH